MKNKIFNILSWVFAILPIIIIILTYEKLPNMIPMQWGSDGVVNRYDDKNSIWIIGCLGIILRIFFIILPKIDPKRKNYNKFQGFYEGFTLFMMTFIFIITSIIIFESLYPNRINIDRVISILLGVFFIIIGNYMPKIKPNFFMGIKNPWTISNEDVWKKTHRLGGKIFFIIGICITLIGFILNRKISFIITIFIFIACIVLYVMSYIWYKKIEKQIK